MEAPPKHCRHRLIRPCTMQLYKSLLGMVCISVDCRLLLSIICCIVLPFSVSRLIIQTWLIESCLAFYIVDYQILTAVKWAIMC